MEECNYRLVGELSVPKSKKDELNGYVLKILHKCGMRKTKKIKLAGRELTVLAIPEPDENGIVWFDYSYFERKLREPSSYNTRTCELITPDRGYNEYGLVMNMIMLLLEEYSNTPCFLVDKDTLFNVCGYVKVINSVLDTSLVLTKRSKAWNVLRALRKGGLSNIGFDEIKAGIDYTGHMNVDIEQLLAISHIEKDSNLYDKPKFYVDDKASYGQQKQPQQHLILKDILKNIIEKGEGELLTEYLKILLETPLKERKKMAESDDEYGKLAQMSRYLLPPIIVHALAYVQKRDFWELWNDLGVEGYDDIESELRGDFSDGKGVGKSAFFIATLRDDEDEFIEFWDKRKLLLSKNMEHNLEKWADAYKELVIKSDFDMESCLAAVIEDMYEVYDCRYVDECWVKEFLDNAHKDSYIKAFMVLQDMVDADEKRFPELTKSQVREWVIKRKSTQKDAITFSAYQSLMVNHKQRKRIFGF